MISIIPVQTRDNESSLLVVGENEKSLMPLRKGELHKLLDLD